MSYISLLTEHELGNEFIWSNYGLYFAFLCRGDTEFVQRSRNLVENYGMVQNGKIYTLDTRDSKGIYVLMPQERLLSSLSKYFEWEIITECKKEIDYKITMVDDSPVVSWDEILCEQLSWERALLFWNDFIKKDNLLALQFDSTGFDGDSNYRVGNLMDGADHRDYDKWDSPIKKAL